MTLRKIWQIWRAFWFEPKSPLPIAIFRIFFGLLVLQSVIIHTLPAMSFWYGNHGIMSIDTVKEFFWFSDPCFDVLPLFSGSEQSLSLFFTILTVAAVFLTLGLFTRLSAVIVCLFLISMHHHQPYNINGGDSYLRLVSIFLAFSNCGTMLSLDRLWQRVLVYPPPTTLCSPWAQRMVQVQLAIVYWQTFCCKIVGPQWLDGTAVYYATRLDDMMKFGPSMLLNNIWMCKLLSWGTLLIEFGMWSLVWLKELRYIFLVGALFLHLGIDMTINLPVFEWAFICSLITFVYPEDLSRFGDMSKAYIAKLFGPPASLVYDPTFIAEAHLVSVIEALDVFGRLKTTECIKTLENGTASVQKRIPGLTLQTKDGATTGYRALIGLSLRLPLLYVFSPILILLSLESIGPSTMRWLGGFWSRRDAQLSTAPAGTTLVAPSDKVANP